MTCTHKKQRLTSHLLSPSPQASFTLPKMRVQRVSPSHPPRGRGGECPISHGHGRGLLLPVDLNLLHLLLYLLKLHLLLSLLGKLLHLGHPHGRLLLLVVMVGIDRVALCSVGSILWLGGGVERHDRVLHVLLRLFRYKARI